MTELKAFFRCIAAHVKMEMMYRTHLVVGLVSQLTFSLLSIVFVGVFLPPGSSLQGWGFWEILIVLGLGDATFADAGPLEDPLVAGLDQLLEIGGREPAGGEVHADARDAGGEQRACGHAHPSRQGNRPGRARTPER